MGKYCGKEGFVSRNSFFIFLVMLFRNINGKFFVKYKGKLGREGNVGRDTLCLNLNFF